MSAKKKNPGPSLRSLAGLAGVSVSTVSRALRNHATISAPVRRRLQALARRHGYEANPLVAQVYAKARAGRGFGLLGTLAYVTAYETPDWWRRHPTLCGFHDGVVERARQMGLRVDEFWAHEPGLKGPRLTQILRARGIGGVVLAPVPGRNAAGLFDWEHFSVALLGESVRIPRLHRAASNLRQVMQVALRELTRLGYRRIGLALRRRYHSNTDFNLLSTFLLFQRDLRAADRVPVQAPENWTEEIFLAWFKRHRPDAVIGAVEAVRGWLAKAGYQCPRDIGLVSLDWNEGAKEFASVDQNPRAVGAAAVDLVMAQMRHNERGIPETPLTVLVDSAWRPGRTVRRHGASWTPAFLADATAGEVQAGAEKRAP
jgi:LacI family transcriptional regulator